MDIKSDNKQGQAFESLGDFFLAMRQKEKALLSFGEALASWNGSLAIAPNHETRRRWRDELQARVKGHKLGRRC